MDYRIENAGKPQWRDARAESVLKDIQNILGISGVQSIRSRSVFTVCADITPEQAEKVAREFANPVTQDAFVGQSDIATWPDFDYLIVVGYRPGVTDNVARTAHEAIGDIIGRKLTKQEEVFSSVEYMIKGDLSREQLSRIGRDLLANELIQTVRVFTRAELEKAPSPSTSLRSAPSAKAWSVNSTWKFPIPNSSNSAARAPGP